MRDAEAGEGGMRTGSIALVGRPNAGKSTLMNRWLGEKLAIVSDKPQTTRHRLIGLLTDADGQVIFLDTPGIHKPLHHLNERMMWHAEEAMREADVLCLLVDASTRFGSGDAYLLERIREREQPAFVALNKVDRVKKSALLPRIERYAEGDRFEAIVPISALTGDGCDHLLELLRARLPEGPPIHPADLLTPQPERYMVAERIREQVLQQTRDELPFTTAVQIDRWEDKGERVVLYATILVERSGQKKILVGRGGSRIKSIGTAARKELEALLDRPVYLDLRVRHQADWREDRRLLARLESDVLE